MSSTGMAMDYMKLPGLVDGELQDKDKAIDELVPGWVSTGVCKCVLCVRV
jgi:hypothetical protein